MWWWCVRAACRPSAKRPPAAIVNQRPATRVRVAFVLAKACQVFEAARALRCSGNSG